MAYYPTDTDIVLVSQVSQKKVMIKIEVLNANGTILDSLEGLINDGQCTIDSSSYIRRTFNFTIVPTRQSIKIQQDSLLWLDKDLHIYVGLFNIRTQKYIWYSQGYYVINKSSYSYNVTTNELKLSCSDWMTKLDGTINGTLGTLTTEIKPYRQDDYGNALDKNGNLVLESGEEPDYYIIRDVVIGILKEVGINKYLVDDIGEYNGMKYYNEDYLSYREKHPQWNCIPYELEFKCDDSYGSILEKICELYSNYDSAFDEDGIFTIKMIPSTFEDDIVLDNYHIQNMLVADNSESTTLDMTTVRNVAEVWGKTFEPDNYTEVCSYDSSTDTYDVTCEYYDGYESSNTIGIKISETNGSKSYINVNNLGARAIYDENTDTFIDTNTLEKDQIYVFKFLNNYFYLLGQFQVHAVNVISNETQTSIYNKEYFQELYNCRAVSITIIPDSPFAIEKIGIRKAAYNDDTCTNITSDSLALSYAEYLNWQKARLTDEIELTLALIPWLKEYTKISYQPKNSDEINQYLIKQITHNYSSGTTTIKACRFYPLYDVKQ